MTSHRTPMPAIPLVTSSGDSLPLLGFTVWWSLAGARVPHGALASALSQAGFGAHLPDPPSYHVALRRALVALLRDRAAVAALPDEESLEAASDQVRRFQRAVTERGTGRTLFALIQEGVDFRALGLAHATALRLLLDRREGWIVMTTRAHGDIPPLAPGSARVGEIRPLDDEARPLAEALRPYWQRYQGLHFPGDLSEMMRAIVCGGRAPGSRSATPGMGGVSVRQGGGLYLVPAEQRGALARLATLVQGFPTSGTHEPYLVAQGLVDEAGAKRALARATHASFLEEIASLRQDLARLGDAEKHRPTTLVARLRAYRQLRGRVESYADLLGMQQEDLLAGLAALKHEATALLGADGLLGGAEPANMAAA